MGYRRCIGPVCLNPQREVGPWHGCSQLKTQRCVSATSDVATTRHISFDVRPRRKESEWLSYQRLFLIQLLTEDE